MLKGKSFNQEFYIKQKYHEMEGKNLKEAFAHRPDQQEILKGVLQIKGKL
jgi:hypothetical protein